MAKTAPRAVRISDEVWEAAQARAKDDGVTTTDVVRQALIAYLGLPPETTGYNADRQRTGLASDNG
jgi:antitoxin component of RelBE/YafQ-DinJ toxin-antitoxin module